MDFSRLKIFVLGHTLHRRLICQLRFYCSLLVGTFSMV
ncbi:unnamed protein product [Spirodela intermedia]|uniref:Uncharacterized protein n=1 Tax=Spirodela intermedia TaxID=51605 RepID=A0A7I8L8L5_SPIIN|nr:unnamed protein product [Spirodela intermedia]